MGRLGAETVTMDLIMCCSVNLMRKGIHGASLLNS